MIASFFISVSELHGYVQRGRIDIDHLGVNPYGVLPISSVSLPISRSAKRAEPRSLITLRLLRARQTRPLRQPSLHSTLPPNF